VYVNPRHELTDQESLFALMASRPLGAWVCQGREGLIANHVPFLLDRSRGPQAYITPGWYPSKAEHGKVVPTWNYVVAHAHGMARAIEDRDGLLDMLNRLTDVHEARRAVPWRVGDAPSSFIDQLLRAIVGIEIPVDRLEGKLKASQDEALQDRLGTVRGLHGETSAEAGSMADLVMKAMGAEAAGRS
jgi:transcriptional regulator